MKFDFNRNEFIDITDFVEKPFIVGSDLILSQKQVFDLHLKLKCVITELNIPSGHPICIYGEKEAMFPVVMITLISLNIPYIPIDVIMPTGRISKIQEQTNSQVVINCSDKLCEVDFPITLSKTFDVIKNKLKGPYDLLENKEDPIRYILFTSGSTGVPKGVQITAKALNSFANWYLTWPLINAESVLMNQAPFSFDVSLCDFLACFGNGSTIVLNDYVILKNGILFLQRLKAFNVTTLVCTPAFITMYLSVPEFNEIDFPFINQFVFMGEELPVVTVKKLKNKFPNSKVINAFGPTEATVVTTYIEITDSILTAYPKALPIGYCRPNAEMFILNKDNETGIGEIGICGNHLSIGYLNDIEKTNAAFITYNGKRVYKTGDVGYIKDDIIFYLGRNDNQVKLNGYRIELEEITNVLLTHPAIKNATVIPLTTKGVTKKIISFIILSHNINDLNEDLKSFLLKELPHYMIPSEFIIKEEFPLNTNYKTDKKALLEEYLSNN